MDSKAVIILVLLQPPHASWTQSICPNWRYSDW